MTDSEVESWRVMDDAVLKEIRSWVDVEMAKRAKLGRITYGTTFQGIPLKHAQEEALDLIFYLYMEEQRSKWIDSRVETSVSLTIQQLQEESHQTAVDHGWWWEDGERNFGEMCALITSEVSEAFEEFRNGHAIDEIYYVQDKDGNLKPEGIPIELADVLIRIGDNCERHKINLTTALQLKMEYNKSRPYRHGGKKA